MGSDTGGSGSGRSGTRGETRVEGKTEETAPSPLALDPDSSSPDSSPGRPSFPPHPPPPARMDHRLGLRVPPTTAPERACQGLQGTGTHVEGGEEGVGGRPRGPVGGPYFSRNTPTYPVPPQPPSLPTRPTAVLPPRSRGIWVGGWTLGSVPSTGWRNSGAPGVSAGGTCSSRTHCFWGGERVSG